MLPRASTNPLAPLALAITLVLGAYAGRLYWLQVVQYEQYQAASNENLIRLEPIRALRGEIRTRDGKVLVANRAAVDLVYKGGEVRFYDRIARVAGLDPGRPLPKLGRGEEAVLRPNVPDSAVVGLAEWVAGQPALELRTRVERVYPSGMAGNLLGYTRLAVESDVQKGYTIDDLTGATGLEAGLEASLKGRNGLKFVQVDAGGRAVGESVQQEAVPGKDVVLTIDSRLQAAAERAIVEARDTINKLNKRNGKPLVREARGAIVALDPWTGEVLALATGPRLDPNWFSRRPAPPEVARALLDTTYKPTWNRSVKIFEPGSTFKLVTASAYLENGYGNSVFTCYPGWFWGGRTWKNWDRVRNQGPMDARKAIANSCNTWYYQATVAAGTERFGEQLAARARQFGFGQPTGIELLGEMTGEVPSPSSFKAQGRDWWRGNSLSFAIGQAEMRATPIQIARMLATVVTDGQRPQLTVVKSVAGKPQPLKPAYRVPGKYWSMLREGMRGTVVQGTATFELGLNRFGKLEFPVKTAGKTGTAQNPAGPGLDHAWYMGFGPYEKPDIVVAAFFEEGVEGSGVALPAVKKVFAARWNVKLDEKGEWDSENDPAWGPKAGALADAARAERGNP